MALTIPVTEEFLLGSCMLTWVSKVCFELSSGAQPPLTRLDTRLGREDLPVAPTESANPPTSEGYVVYQTNSDLDGGIIRVMYGRDFSKCVPKLRTRERL
jgi:hypothetical protein